MIKTLLKILLIFLFFALLAFAVFYFWQQFLYQKNLDDAIVATKSAPVNHIGKPLLWLETTSNDSFANKKDDDTIHAWQNKGAFMQKSLAQQPLYKTKAINNLPALYFDDRSFMVDSNFSDLAEKATIFLVLKPSNKQGKQTILSKISNEINFSFSINNKIGNYNYELCLQNPQKKCFISKSIDFDKQIGSQIISILIDSYNYNKGSIAIFANKKLVSSFASGSAFLGEAKSPLNLGRNIDANQVVANYFNDGYIGEIIIYNQFLSDLQRKLIEDYLYKKWLFK